MSDNHLEFFPWRRFLARALDMQIYNLLWLLVLRLVFNLNLSIRSSFSNYLDTSMVLLLMLLIEPILLQRFGTTLGKLVFGIRIENLDQDRLSYWEGFERTWGVIGAGLGYGIPILNIYRLYKRYKLCTNKERQPWDDEISYSISGMKWYRGFLYVAAAALVIYMMTLTITVDTLPPNRGELTIDEFAENFNYLTHHYKIDIGGRRLLPDGKWNYSHQDDIKYPEFFYVLEGGYIAEVGFQIELVDYDKWISSYDNQMILSALSFVGAQKNISLFSKTRKEIIEMILGNSLQNFEFEESGITVMNDVEHSGYVGRQILVPDEGSKENRFRLFFSMKKIDKIE